MSSTDQAPEPTMDEILASIRRIIADDPADTPQPEVANKTDDDVFELSDSLIANQAPAQTAPAQHTPPSNYAPQFEQPAPFNAGVAAQAQAIQTDQFPNQQMEPELTNAAYQHPQPDPAMMPEPQNFEQDFNQQQPDMGALPEQQAYPAANMPDPNLPDGGADVYALNANQAAYTPEPTHPHQQDAGFVNPNGFAPEQQNQDFNANYPHPGHPIHNGPGVQAQPSQMPLNFATTEGALAENLEQQSQFMPPMEDHNAPVQPQFAEPSEQDNGQGGVYVEPAPGFAPFSVPEQPAGGNIFGTTEAAPIEPNEEQTSGEVFATETVELEPTQKVPAEPDAPAFAPMSAPEAAPEPAQQASIETTEFAVETEQPEISTPENFESSEPFENDVEVATDSIDQAQFEENTAGFIPSEQSTSTQDEGFYPSQAEQTSPVADQDIHNQLEIAATQSLQDVLTTEETVTLEDVSEPAPQEIEHNAVQEQTAEAIMPAPAPVAEEISGQEAAKTAPKTLEQSIQELLKPMLREWLDDNMPRIVEGVVKDQIDPKS